LINKIDNFEEDKNKYYKQKVILVLLKTCKAEDYQNRGFSFGFFNKFCMTTFLNLLNRLSPSSKFL